MAFKKKAIITGNPFGVEPRDLTAAQRRELFTKGRKAFDKDWRVVKPGAKEELIPFNNLTLDHVLRLYGLARNGTVYQIHGDEGAGKCVGASNLAVTPAGLLYIDEVFQKNALEANCTIGSRPVKYPLLNRTGHVEETAEFTNNGQRPVTAITTVSGNQIVSTDNHPHLVMNASGYWVWRTTGSIVPGDFLVTSRKYNTSIGQRSAMTDEELYFHGVLIADASLGRTKIVATNNDPVVMEALVTAGAPAIGLPPKEYEKGNAGCSVAYHFNSLEKVSALYDKMDWTPGIAKDKHLGSLIRQLCTDQLKIVLQGYFDCECSIDEHGIEVSSASWKLLFEIKTVLQTHFGIISILKPKKVKAYPDNEYWRLNLYGQSAVEFIAQIGFQSDIRKQQALAIDCAKERVYNHNRDSIPGIGLVLTSLYDSHETTCEHNFAVRDYKGSSPQAMPTYARLGRILALPWTECAPLTRLREIMNAGYYYDEVESVEARDPEPTFDFVMPDSHSFHVANIITHNSTLGYAILGEYQRSQGEPVAIFDFERTTKPWYLDKMGVNQKMLLLKKPDSIEDAVKDARKLMKEDGVRLFMFDSIPRMRSMVPDEDIKSGDAFKNTMGVHAKAMTLFYDLMLPHISAVDGSLIMINQTRSRIEMTREAQSAAKGYSTVTNLNYSLPGGRANRYAISAMLEMTTVKAWKAGKHTDEFVLEAEAKNGEDYVANEIRVRTLKNKITGTGYRQGTLWLRPGVGLDENISIRQMAREMGLITNYGKKYYVGEAFENAIKVYDSKQAAIDDLVTTPNLKVLEQLKHLVVSHLTNDVGIGKLEVSEQVSRHLAGEDDNQAEYEDVDSPTPVVVDEDL